MAMFGRFFITYAMNTGTQITFEVVPTELRGQGGNSIDTFWLEFWLETPPEFWLEIPLEWFRLNHSLDPFEQVRFK